MSDEKQNENNNNGSADNANKEVEDLKVQLEALKSKSQELLDETKKAKAKVKAEEDAKVQAELDIAKKKGDYEQLLKSSEEQRKELSDQLDGLNNKISTEKTQSASLKLAAELADGTNAELLSEFISKRLRYTDDGLKVLDKNGGLTVSSLDDLKREFQANDKYKSLIRGNQSNGGGASGGESGASQNKVLTRSDFDKLDSPEKMKFMKDGGKLVDNK